MGGKGGPIGGRRNRGVMQTTTNVFSLLLEMCELVGIVGQVRKHHPLLIVRTTQDLVVKEVESVTNTKSGKKTNISFWGQRLKGSDKKCFDFYMAMGALLTPL